MEATLKEKFDSNDKKQILPELYLLRAQLSFVSQQKDKIDEEQTNQKNKQIETYKAIANKKDFKNLGSWQSESFYRKKVYTDDELCDFFATEKDLSEVREDAKKYDREMNDNLRGAEKSANCIRIFSTLTVISIIGIIIGIFVHVALTVCASIATVIFMVLTIFSIVFYKDYKEWVRIRKSDYNDCIDYINKTRKEYKAKIEQINTNYKNTIVPYVEAADPVITAMTEYYSDVLDQRDWQYLDQIIYYFETNRASSLKEALQLVDMERRKQETVSIIAIATEAICTSITEGFAAIQNSIAQGFASMQQTLQSGLTELNQTAREQLTATNLSNALQVKANTTSEQLTNDMRLIRNKYYY